MEYILLNDEKKNTFEKNKKKKKEKNKKHSFLFVGMKNVGVYTTNLKQ